eukprot:ANDGO_06538.mRNA.1 Origin recognition complex subunit 1
MAPKRTRNERANARMKKTENDVLEDASSNEDDEVQRKRARVAVHSDAEGVILIEDDERMVVERSEESESEGPRHSYSTRRNSKRLQQQNQDPETTGNAQSGSAAVRLGDSDSESAIDSDDINARNGDVCLNGVFCAKRDLLLEQGKRRYYSALMLKTGIVVSLGDFVCVESGDPEVEYIAMIDRVFTVKSVAAKRRCQVRCRWCFRSHEAVSSDGSYFELGHDRAELMISDVFNLNAAHFIKRCVVMKCLPSVTDEEKRKFDQLCRNRAPDEYYIRYVYLHEVGTRILISRIPEDSLNPFRQYAVIQDNGLNKPVWDVLDSRWKDLFPLGEYDNGPFDFEDSLGRGMVQAQPKESREEHDKSAARAALEKIKTVGNSIEAPKDLTAVPTVDRYNLAKKQLQLSSVPDKLECRNEERRIILDFLVSKLENTGEGGVMYIAGLPGTGKTATVLECVRKLQGAHEMGECPPFQFVHVNGMALSDPTQLYRILYNAITGKTVFPAHAGELLEKMFRAQSAKRVCCVLLIDELDQIVTKGIRVIYNMVEWSIRPFSQLVLVSIANTMDLPERLLPRIASRFGTSRIQFAPYSQPQLVQILVSRIADTFVFDPASIDFISQKVAQLGDCRRALHLCSLAVDSAMREWKRFGRSSSPVLVSVKHVDEALVQMALSARVLVSAIRDLPLLAKRVLCQLANLSMIQKDNFGAGASDYIRIDSLCDRVLSFYVGQDRKQASVSRVDVYHVIHQPLQSMNLVHVSTSATEMGSVGDSASTTIKFKSVVRKDRSENALPKVRLLLDVLELKRCFGEDPDPGCALKDPATSGIRR